MSDLESDAISADDVIAVMRTSHQRLASLLGSLDADQLNGPSYDDDWTIAQVASHLGSGSEIFELYLEAGLSQTSAPGMDQFQSIWDDWNAKSPPQQAEDAVAASARFLDRLDVLSAEQRVGWAMELFGAEHTFATFLRMRMTEHAMHTWDIAVALDPTATVSSDAIDFIVDTLSSTVGYVGKPANQAVRVHIRTADPERAFVLELTTDAATLTPAESTSGNSGGQLDLPAEALVRLVFGRLDPDHTPSALRAHDVDLDVLRQSFPGL